MIFNYIDPGSGSALISLLIAAASGVVYLLRSILGRLFRGGGVMKRKIGASPSYINEAEALAIFSEGKNYWPTYEPIVNALIHVKVPFKYYTMDIADPGLTIENSLMDSRFIGAGTRGYMRISRISNPIVLTTTPNFNTPGFPVKKSPHVKKLVYVFHAVNDISPLAKHSLDAFDVILLSGEFQVSSIREIEKIRKLPPKTMLLTGLPYLDYLASDLASVTGQTDNDYAAVSQDRPVVLLGPSWGEKGFFKHYGSDFIVELSKKYFVIIRPHPQSYISEEQLIDKLKKIASKYSNVVIDNDVSPTKAMKAADILVSDTSALRFDFAFLYEKPVITLEIPEKNMNAYEVSILRETPNWLTASNELLGYSVKNNIDGLTPLIDKALVEFTPKHIATMRDKVLVNFGRVGEVIAKELKLMRDEYLLQTALDSLPKDLADDINKKLTAARDGNSGLRETITPLDH